MKTKNYIKIIFITLLLSGCATYIVPSLQYSLRAANKSENSGSNLDLVVDKVFEDVNYDSEDSILYGGGVTATKEIRGNYSSSYTPITEFSADKLSGYKKYKKAMLHIVLMSVDAYRNPVRQFKVFLIASNGRADSNDLYTKGRYLGDIGYYFPHEALVNNQRYIKRLKIDITGYLDELLDNNAKFIGIRIEPFENVAQSIAYVEKIEVE